jgi:dihydroorotate dehydrogenase (fumarate)
MNASGCYSSTIQQLEELDRTPSCGAIVSKSCTLLAQDGNEHPRLYIGENAHTNTCTNICINSMGLPNLGHKYYSNITTNKLYIQSVYPKNIGELDELFTTKTNIIEVNMSCPNVVTSYKFNNYELYLDKINQIKKDKIIGIKLPPLFDLEEYNIMSNLLLKYNISFITCTNTIPNCLVIDYKKEETVIRPNNGLGGMSFKPVSLSNVYNFYRILGDKIDIIGCGGIMTGLDVFEYILCGAKCVQLGSCLLKEGGNSFGRIEKELYDIMEVKGYNNVDDFRGRVRVCRAKL